MCSAKCAIPFCSAVSYREPAESMTKHDTDPTCWKGAVRTRTPFPSVDFSKMDTGFDGIDTTHARSADPQGDRGAARVARPGVRAGRRSTASGRRTRPLHRLRYRVPRCTRVRAG